ncbi:GNAT family N-acetyltransferase [Staphylococcus gallinarum]|uniref:GNAT family N-acetyltransferase n=1 Tax=Staphylococcus gallinarum TaxID=1293 RepID=UPI002DBB6948|nr:GNAT family N-acetyltransferase [Staphylococcus gallinarum]MEB7040069.1 GNAT family N-acetyltransferase [Staphylococcus gallinarum]
MITFRQAAIEDISKISNLRMNLINNPNSHYGSNDYKELNDIDESFRSWLKENIYKDDINVIISCNDEGTITSMGVGVIDKRAPINGALNGKVGWISSLIVPPEFRKNKLGSETLNHLLEWFDKNEVSKVTLQSTEDGEVMYKKLGFIKSNESTLIRG